MYGMFLLRIRSEKVWGGGKFQHGFETPCLWVKKSGQISLFKIGMFVSYKVEEKKDVPGWSLNSYLVRYSINQGSVASFGHHICSQVNFEPLIDL